MAIESPFKVAAQAAIEGGAWVDTKFLDGTVEKLFVRVPLRRFQDYLDNGGEMHAIVEMACGKPEGWTDGVTDASIFKLFETARLVTDPRIASWIKALNQEAEKLREKKKAASPSSDSPPGS